MTTSYPRHAEAPTSTTARTDQSEHRRRHGVGFWLVSLAFLTAMAFSTVPTPLYPIYQQRDGFSALMVTVVFAVYAVGVVASLLLVGHISDHLGRKRALIPALVLEALASVIFLVAPGLPGLIIARLVTGLGVGMITATATVYLNDLHTVHRPEAGRGRFEAVSTAANIGGLGVGPLVAGFLAQYVSAPLRTPYIVFAVLLLLSAVAVSLSPETVDLAASRRPYRPQRIGATHGDRAAYAAAAAGAFGAFAVFGLFTSLAPGFVAVTLHHPSRLLAGAIVFLVFGVAATAQTASNRMDPHTRFATALFAEAVGLVLLAIGTGQASLTWFLLGGAVAGAGAGVLFKAALGSIAASAPAEVRGEALAGLFLIAYLGLIGPAVGLGIATRYTQVTTAMYAFSGVLLLVLLGAAILNRTTRRGRPARSI